MGKDILQKLQKYNIDADLFKAYAFEVKDISPVRESYRIETSKGPLYLKKTENEEAKMLFVVSAMEHLRRNGFPWIPRFEATLDGRLFVNCNNRVYFVSEWIEGRECDFHRPKELLTAVKTLARMHVASKGFQPPPGSKVKTNWGQLPEKLHKQTQELIKYKEIASGKEQKADFDKLYLANADDFIEMARQSLDFLENSDYLALVERAMEEKGFCHCDYTYHNILIVGEKQYYVVDFDYCRFELHVYDLVKMMRRALSRLDWDVQTGISMVNAYHNVIPLSEEERKVLLSTLYFPQKFWRHAERYYNRKKEINEKEFTKDLEKIIKQKKLIKKFLDGFSMEVLNPGKES